MMSLILMCPTVTCWWVFCYKSIYHISLKSPYRWRESDLQRIDGPGPDADYFPECGEKEAAWRSDAAHICGQQLLDLPDDQRWGAEWEETRGGGGNSVQHIKTTLVCNIQPYAWHKHHSRHLLDMFLVVLSKSRDMDITYIHYRWNRSADGRLNSGCYLCRHPVWPWQHRQFAQKLVMWPVREPR